jgi:LAO/AO transport system kinase
MLECVPAHTYQRLAAGDLRALARAVSMVEDGSPGAQELLAACAASGKLARRIGVTGPPGAGKSTLVDQLVRLLRAQGKTVAVLAVDPSSPYTGGALLGDRIRMNGFAGDPGVYIRSMASRGASGGIGRAAASVCLLMEAAGRDVVILETVGVGQDEVAVAELADVTLLVLVPGLGDDVQSLKAGIMEVADVFVVNKSDLPGAERVEAEILAMQSLVCGEGWIPPVLKTVASTGEGVAALLEVVSGFVSSKGQATVPLAGATIDHLGIAVKSIAAAKQFYALLGMHVTHEETVEHEQVHTAMLPAGESRLELLEPTAEDSTIGRFLARRGEGLHHVAMRVTGLDERFAALQQAGVRLASESIRVGAGGHRYFFVHPSATGGVLVELVEAAH